MNLEKAIRISTGECFACRWAGQPMKVWPLEKVGITVTGWWKIYIDDPTHILQYHKTAAWFCDTHYPKLEEEWVNSALAEVWLDYLWHEYMDGME